jgi:hypothetical protein
MVAGFFGSTYRWKALRAEKAVFFDEKAVEAVLIASRMRETESVAEYDRERQRPNHVTLHAVENAAAR